MTTAKDFEVDKYGKRVQRRKNEVLGDGEFLRVPMTLMDEQGRAMRDASAQLENHQLSAFADAVNGGMSLADAIAKAKGLKRVEQFDMRQHPQASRYGTRDAASDSAREARDARMRDAWKQPTSINATATETVAVVGPSAPDAQLFAARDAAIAARDKRLASAWAKP